MGVKVKDLEGYSAAELELIVIISIISLLLN